VQNTTCAAHAPPGRTHSAPLLLHTSVIHHQTDTDARHSAHQDSTTTCQARGQGHDFHPPACLPWQESGARCSPSQTWQCRQENACHKQKYGVQTLLNRRTRDTRTEQHSGEDANGTANTLSITKASSLRHRATQGRAHAKQITLVSSQINTLPTCLGRAES